MTKKFALFLILFSWLTIPPIYRISGLVSLNWIYITFLDVILIFLTFFNKSSIKFQNKIPQTFYLFFIYLLISLFWSYSPIDSLRYLNKFILLSTAMIFFSNNIEIDELFYKKIISAIVFFIIVNFFAELTIKHYIWSFPAGEYFEGLGGRHQIKYFAAFSFFFIFYSYIIIKHKKYLLILSLIIIMLALILQRGVLSSILLSLVLGMLIFFKENYKLKFRLILMIFVFSSFVIYFLFYSEKGIAYMFYSETQRNKFITTLFTDPLYAYQYIDFKGRLEYWDVLLSEANFIYGLGFGSSGRVLEENFGFYNELHNDWLQILVELGIIGLIFYVLFWFNYFKAITKLLHSSNNKISQIFLATSLSFGIYVIINGFVDHVIDYSSTAISLSMCVGFITAVDKNIKR
jgi:O-antigen ligase